MKTALCLGGAACVWEDVARCPVPFDYVIACNDAGVEWPGELDAWVSLHHKKLNDWSAKREARRHSPAKAFYVHDLTGSPKSATMTEYVFPGTKMTGSSGLFMAKVALFDMGIDRVIFCGVPMTLQKHFFGGPDWGAFGSYRKIWPDVAPEHRDRMRSMSGWTRLLLGPPNDWK